MKDKDYVGLCAMNVSQWPRFVVITKGRLLTRLGAHMHDHLHLNT